MKINSEAYWNERFHTNWAANHGSQQTDFFANIALELLPKWLSNWINEHEMTIADWGCALGEGAFALSKAFSTAKVTGIDVSVNAINLAKTMFPTVNFVAEDWQSNAGKSQYDIVFSSNTLEHFDDPWSKADLLAHTAKAFVILLLPYREFKRIDEHSVTFDSNAIPINIGDGAFTLVHSEIADCRSRTPTFWNGEQILLVYVRNICLPKLDLKLDALSFVADLSQSPKNLRRSLVNSKEETRRAANKLARREFELALANARLNQLMTSKSWRWTAWIRESINLMRVIKQRISQVRSAYKLAGISGVLNKSVRYFQQKTAAKKSYVPEVGLMIADGLKVDAELSSNLGGAHSLSNSVAADAPSIAMLVDNFFDGGLERVVIDLCVELRGRGFSAWILVANRGGRAMAEARQMGIWVEECCGSAARVESLLTTHAVKAVLTHCCYSHFETISKHAIPLIEVLHNAYFWNLGDERLHQLRLLNVSRYIAVSESAAEFATEFLQIPAGNLDVINNGLNPKGLIRPPTKMRAGLRSRTDGEVVLVHAASFGPQKRHALVLAAFEKMAARNSKLKLILAGSPEVDPEVYKRVRNIAATSSYVDRIQFAGVLNRREISLLLASSHIALLPSAVEGFSIASLEFAYFGLPCVMSDTGAANEFIDKYKHGIVVKGASIPLDELSPMAISAACWEVPVAVVDALVEAVETIASNYDYWGAKSEDAAARWHEYSISQTADQYADVLSQFINLPRSMYG
jgi:glycosyltransferase involved in cell wall biosynthesis